MQVTQNYLLELKIAVIRTLPYDVFWNMFGIGTYVFFKDIYSALLQPLLSYGARRFWDVRQFYFDPVYGGLYNNASAPVRFCNTICKNLWPNGYDAFLQEQCVNVEDQLAVCSDPELRRVVEAYGWVHRHTRWLPCVAVIESQWQDNDPAAVLINGITRRAMVPRSFCIDYVTRLYTTGTFTEKCCPDYLRIENYPRLRDNVHRISIVEGGMIQCMMILKSLEVKVDSFFLLDHLDYLTPSEVRREMALIDKLTKHLHPGTQIAVIKCVSRTPSYLSIITLYFDVIDITEDLCYDGSDMYMVQSAYILYIKKYRELKHDKQTC
jgi:S-adenosylmethionine-diacylglycerol 3-amino-3-carboxypropyl transferase